MDGTPLPLADDASPAAPAGGRAAAHPFDWETLLEFIRRERSVVPVVGQELLGPAGESFGATLAARVARDFSLPETA